MIKHGLNPGPVRSHTHKEVVEEDTGVEFILVFFLSRGGWKEQAMTLN